MLLSFSVVVLVFVGGGRKDGKERRRRVGMIVVSRVYAGMGSSLVRGVMCSMLFCESEGVSELDCE